MLVPSRLLLHSRLYACCIGMLYGYVLPARSRVWSKTKHAQIFSSKAVTASLFGSTSASPKACLPHVHTPADTLFDRRELSNGAWRMPDCTNVHAHVYAHV